MPNDTTKSAPDERAMLQPCPFCGVVPYSCWTSIGNVRWLHGPNDCALSNANIHDAAAWNTRTPPQVKALVWGLTSYRMPEVECVLGTYRISGARDYGFNCHIGRNALEMSDGRTNFATIDDAKAAAQADYTRRILEALA